MREFDEFEDQNVFLVEIGRAKKNFNLSLIKLKGHQNVGSYHETYPFLHRLTSTLHKMQSGIVQNIELDLSPAQHVIS